MVPRAQTLESAPPGLPWGCSGVGTIHLALLTAATACVPTCHGTWVPGDPGDTAEPSSPTSQQATIVSLVPYQMFVLTPALHRQCFGWAGNPCASRQNPFLSGRFVVL